VLVIGIDPGANGGIAIIPVYAFHETKTIALADYTLYQIADMFKEIRYGSPDISDQEYRLDTQVEVFLEEPQLPRFTPKKAQFSVQAHNKLGRSLGQLEGLCIAMNWRVNGLSPQKWQNALGCKTGGDKNVSKSFAEAAFPFLTRTSAKGIVSSRGVGTVRSAVTHAIADALLIAAYGYLQYTTRVPSSVRHTFRTSIVDEAGKNGQPIRKSEPPRPRVNERPTVSNVARPSSVARGIPSASVAGTKRAVPCKPLRK